MTDELFFCLMNDLLEISFVTHKTQGEYLVTLFFFFNEHHLFCLVGMLFKLLKERGFSLNLLRFSISFIF